MQSHADHGHFMCLLVPLCVKALSGGRGGQDPEMFVTQSMPPGAAATEMQHQLICMCAVALECRHCAGLAWDRTREIKGGDGVTEFN
jgi:hypothetical protein